MPPPCRGWAQASPGSHLLAFIITAVIGGVYLLGIVELLHFRRATSTLESALQNIPAQTDNTGVGCNSGSTGSTVIARGGAVAHRGRPGGFAAPVFTTLSVCW